MTVETHGIKTTRERFERAKELASRGCVTPDSSEPTVYYVSGYVVNIETRRCTCPDASYRKMICKHILAAALVYLKVA